jgi:hypothetical protein
LCEVWSPNSKRQPGREENDQWKREWRPKLAEHDPVFGSLPVFGGVVHFPNKRDRDEALD